MPWVGRYGADPSGFAVPRSAGAFKNWTALLAAIATFSLAFGHFRSWSAPACPTSRHAFASDPASRRLPSPSRSRSSIGSPLAQLRGARAESRCRRQLAFDLPRNPAALMNSDAVSGGGHRQRCSGTPLSALIIDALSLGRSYSLRPPYFSAVFDARDGAHAGAYRGWLPVALEARDLKAIARRLSGGLVAPDCSPSRATLASRPGRIGPLTAMSALHGGLGLPPAAALHWVVGPA